MVLSLRLKAGVSSVSSKAQYWVTVVVRYIFFVSTNI